MQSYKTITELNAELGVLKGLSFYGHNNPLNNFYQKISCFRALLYKNSWWLSLSLAVMGFLGVSL